MPNYTLPDGETVKNKLGARSHDDLEKREVGPFAARQTEHLLDPRIPRTFDAAHLKGLHRQFFQDVYEWAGHSRDEKVKLSDGTIATEPLLYRPGTKPFATGAEIAEGLESMSTRLKEQDYLRGLPRTEFALRAATTLATINSIHPFREGNGRTQRQFLQELAEDAGHHLDFRVVSRERMIQVSIAAHQEKDIGPMRRLLDEISNPNRVAALTPAIGFLDAQKYPWNDRYLATTEPGHTETVTMVGINGPHFMSRTSATILIGQRSDLPDPNAKSGDQAKVFPTAWPEPGVPDTENPRARPSPRP